VKVADVHDPSEEQARLDQLYAVVGEADEAELVSESLLRERHDEAAREVNEHE